MILKKIFLFLFILFIPIFTYADSNLIESDFYFGLSKRDGKIISNVDFAKFEKRVIVKNFQKGFTVENGKGEWLSNNKTIIMEPSKILVIIYKPTLINKEKVKNIASEYKKVFQQESVLVVTKKVKVKFY